MTKLVEVSLPETLGAIVDNRGRTCPTADTGIPLIATNCIKAGYREPVFENVRHVDGVTYANWFRGHPIPGDIVFVCKGSPGRVAMVPDPVPFCIAQDMVALRPDHDVVDGAYLYYRLTTPDISAKIEHLHVGTMIPHFKKKDFGQLRFTIHESRAEQRAIAEVLGALDDKIAANRRVSQVSDDLAGTHFQAARHRGGELKPLTDLAEFINGKAFTKDASGTGRIVVRIAELNGGPGGSTVRNDIEVADRHLARPGDLLFAWSGSLTVHRWFRQEAIVNQHIFKVIPRGGVPMWVVNGAVRAKLEGFRRIAANKATTMGHIQRRHLDEPVLVPTDDEVRQLDGVMSALWLRALSAEQENERLATTRDALLPLLMSGKVRVKDVEDQVGEMV